MDINAIILNINHVLWGWPLVLFILGVASYATIALGFVQFRYFKKAWQLLLFPEKGNLEGDMSPLEAFINALSTAVGNGSIAGVATAIYAGGPGAAVWIFVLGLLSMALRYSEVFLANYYPPITKDGYIVGGPMVYLTKLPGGKYLSYMFAFFLLYLSLASGNAMQANSISLGFERILGISPWAVAFALLAFMAYVMAGGARRIVEVSDKIVPIKVGVFFVSAIIILGYHYQSLIPALKLMFLGAFYPKALAGGLLGFTIQKAMRYGIVRSLNATEAGLGTAAVLFGGTASKEPVKNGLMSMISVFISANLICFMIAWMIVASGVWDSGQTSLNLTISAYETVFGTFGGWIVTFLSLSFGLGVLVTYSYIARACWFYLTDCRWETVYTVIFCAVTFIGAIAHVDIVWNAIDTANAGLLIANLAGIAWLMPKIRSALKEKEKQNIS